MYQNSSVFQPSFWRRCGFYSSAGRSFVGAGRHTQTHTHTHFPHSVSADSCRLVPLMFGALSDTWSHFPETACETEESTAACMSEPVSTVSTCRLSAVWFGLKGRNETPNNTVDIAHIGLLSFWRRLNCKVLRETLLQLSTSVCLSLSLCPQSRPHKDHATDKRVHSSLR